MDAAGASGRRFLRCPGRLPRRRTCPDNIFCVEVQSICYDRDSQANAEAAGDKR